MKNFFLFLFGLLCVLLADASVRAETPEDSFQRNFPGLHADSIRKSEINGLYEVVSGGRVFYYVPGHEYLIYGSIVNRNGKNLTEERTLSILENGLKAVPIEKALRIGNGPHQIIEITDPDCPYCRRASAYLSGRTDVTRYIFFFPLPMHPNAPAKIRRILCAEDKLTAYGQVMAGKLDDMKFTPCQTPVVEELLKTHREICERIGVTGTPLFLINGQVLIGANIPRIEEMLKEKK